MTRKADSTTRSRAVAPPRARRTRLIVRQLPEETLVYDLDRSRAHCLGPTAASVWRRCDGRSSAARIAAGVRRETGVDVGEAGVWVAVDRLAEARLLEQPVPEGVRSRREWLKQAAMVAGLTVVSITAPLSVEAATCVPNCGSLPNTPGNCGAIPCCPGAGVPAGSFCCRQGSAQNCGCRTPPAACTA
jgi:coenzyme PQQ synthesis protein D (PqqD)